MMLLQSSLFRCASLFVTATALALAQQVTLPPTVPPTQAAGYQLAFDDEFDALDLSPDGSGVHKWYQGIWFNHKYTPLSNIFAANSQLSLVWTAGQPSADTSITTLSRDKTHATTFRYGYFEASMRWDVVTGAWPAFWMIPIQDATQQDIYNGVKESGEIDVFEGQGNQPHTFFGTYHDWVNGQSVASNALNYYALSRGTDLSQFHKYGILWTPGTMTWYFDDVALHTEKVTPIFDKQDFYIVLGMQEGASWTYGNLTGVTANQVTLNADWVRVWQAPASH